MLFNEYLNRAEGDMAEALSDLAADLMRGDPATFKRGYTADNALLAAHEAMLRGGFAANADEIIRAALRLARMHGMVEPS